MAELSENVTANGACNSLAPFLSIDPMEGCDRSVLRSRHSFSKRDLESCAEGQLFGVGNAQLPTTPLMMLDRITDIRSDGGEYGRGYAIAELDIDPEQWFFKHHFKGDPLMPGCFLIESMWQLAGFHLAWSGYAGSGRILDSGTTRFNDTVSAEESTLTISIHVRRTLKGRSPICIANGEIRSGDAVKCTSNAIKIGLF